MKKKSGLKKEKKKKLSNFKFRTALVIGGTFSIWMDYSDFILYSNCKG